MDSDFFPKQEWILLLLAASAVLVPLLVGIAMGHVPRQILLAWAIPLAAATFILAFAIRFLEAAENPPLRFVLNAAFGLVWIIAGIRLALRRSTSTEGVSEAALRTAKSMGGMFVAFGILWVVLSAVQTF